MSRTRLSVEIVISDYLNWYVGQGESFLTEKSNFFTKLNWDSVIGRKIRLGASNINYCTENHYFKKSKKFMTTYCSVFSALARCKCILSYLLLSLIRIIIFQLVNTLCIKGLHTERHTGALYVLDFILRQTSERKSKINYNSYMLL